MNNPFKKMPEYKGLTDSDIERKLDENHLKILELSDQIIKLRKDIDKYDFDGKLEKYHDYNHLFSRMNWENFRNYNYENSDEYRTLARNYKEIQNIKEEIQQLRKDSESLKNQEKIDYEEYEIELKRYNEYCKAVLNSNLLAQQ